MSRGIVKLPVDYVRGLCNNRGMTKKLPPEIKEYFVKQGRKGGKLGGPARAARMTAEQRSESARRAVMARWDRIKGQG